MEEDKLIEKFGPWIKDLSAWCAENDRDLMIREDNNTVYMFGSEPLDALAQAKAETIIPTEYKTVFTESLRVTTMKAFIEACVLAFALPERPVLEGRFLKWNIVGIPVLVEVPSFWNYLSQVIESDPFVTRYELSLNGTPVLGKSRDDEGPDSEAVKTTLESSTTVEDFLKSNLFGGAQ